jgi:hypothetical protein
MKQLKHHQIYYCPENNTIYLYTMFMLDDGVGIYVIDFEEIDWSKLFLIGEL